MPTQEAWATLTNLQTGQVIPLIKHQMTFGRDSSCDVVFGNGKEISRLHFQIQKMETKMETRSQPMALLWDKSTNGTWIDGKQGDGLLKKGSEIHVVDSQTNGGWFFLFEQVNNRQYYICKSPMAVLGKGSFSVVRLGINLKTCQRVAVKTIETDQVPVKTMGGISIAQEISILTALRHPNITRIHAVESTSNHVYLYLQLVYPSVSLLNHIESHGPLVEGKALFVFYQVLQALAYLHSKGVCHRDLKCENILLEGDMPRVLLTDFGMAKATEGPKSMKTQCGTLAYAAPEVFTGLSKMYGNKVDLWSSGVLLYSMLNGFLPWGNGGDKAMAEKILQKAVMMPKDCKLTACSSAVRDLILKGLLVDEPVRLDVEGALSHPWIAAKEPVLSRLYRKMLSKCSWNE